MTLLTDTISMKKLLNRSERAAARISDATGVEVKAIPHSTEGSDYVWYTYQVEGSEYNFAKTAAKYAGRAGREYAARCGGVRTS